MNGSKHFQGTYQGPARTFKNAPKYNNQSGSGGANNNNGNATNYDSPPMKDNGTKMHQQQQQQQQHQHGGHGMSKREHHQQQQQLNVEPEQAMANMQFGSHVPPFPFHDQNETYYGPPPNNGKSDFSHFLTFT